MTKWFRRPKPEQPEHVACSAEVLATQRGATLIRNCDGRVRCWCPFACSWASEPCEFEDHPAKAKPTT